MFEISNIENTKARGKIDVNVDTAIYAYYKITQEYKEKPVWGRFVNELINFSLLINYLSDLNPQNCNDKLDDLKNVIKDRPEFSNSKDDLYIHKLLYFKAKPKCRRDKEKKVCHCLDGNYPLHCNDYNSCYFKFYDKGIEFIQGLTDNKRCANIDKKADSLIDNGFKFFHDYIKEEELKTEYSIRKPINRVLKIFDLLNQPIEMDNKTFLSNIMFVYIFMIEFISSEVNGVKNYDSIIDMLGNYKSYFDKDDSNSKALNYITQKLEAHSITDDYNESLEKKDYYQVIFGLLMKDNKARLSTT